MLRLQIQLYALAVCFCILMCGVIALGVAAYDLVRVAAPGFTMTTSYGAWDSNEQFVRVYPDKKDLPAAEIAALRVKYKSDALSAERTTGQQGFVWAFIILAIDAVVYATHWRIAGRADGARSIEFTAARREPPPPETHSLPQR